MNTIRWAPLLLLLLPAPTIASDAANAVRAAETAFAASMAERDFTAFANFIDDEAVFFGGDGPARGKAAVLEAWAGYFEGDVAPFSWSPDTVEVLASGRLALSSGPVLDAAGRRIATFQSTWRLDESGHWLVVFDKGERWCPPPEPPLDHD